MPDEHHHRSATLGDSGYRESWSASLDDPDPPVGHHPRWGKYRGTVVDNDDPLFKGRLLVTVPSVVITGWALPCVPLTDTGMGVYVRPRIGANVWVEFERGDPDKPIWVGCWWGDGELPPMADASAAVPPVNAVISLETALGGVTICDIPYNGANVLIRGPGATIMMNEAGIQIVSAASVSIEAGYFTVAAPNFTVE